MYVCMSIRVCHREVLVLSVCVYVCILKYVYSYIWREPTPNQHPE
jgi:hypothetical protein